MITGMKIGGVDGLYTCTMYVLGLKPKMSNQQYMVISLNKIPPIACPTFPVCWALGDARSLAADSSSINLMDSRQSNRYRFALSAAASYCVITRVTKSRVRRNSRQLKWAIAASPNTHLLSRFDNHCHVAPVEFLARVSTQAIVRSWCDRPWLIFEVEVDKKTVLLLRDCRRQRNRRCLSMNIQLYPSI